MSLPARKKRKPKVFHGSDNTFGIDLNQNQEKGNIILGIDQQKGMNAIKAFLNKDNKDEFFLLTGLAGTGKTTLCNEIISLFQDLNFALSATTNKALKVLDQLNQNYSCKYPCYTIYKFLGLVPWLEEDSHKLRKLGKERLNHIDVLIIDECSMIGHDLWNHIQDIPLSYKIKIILLGDPAQLPPVSEKVSGSFSIPNHFHLTEVHRQAKENPIIDWAHQIRHLKSGEPIPTPRLDSPHIELIHEEKVWFQNIIKHCKTQNYENDNDFCQTLCWTNKRVHQINQYVHKSLFTESQTPFEINQSLILTQPITKNGWKNNGEIIMNTDETVRLKSLSLESIKNEQSILYYYELVLENLTGTTARIKYISPKSKREWLALDNPQKKTLKIYNEAIHVQAKYTMTVHRSQGSSFNNVFIDIENILLNNNKEEQIKMLYVAITRAREKIYIYGL